MSEDSIHTTGGADADPFNGGLSMPLSRLPLFFLLRLHHDQGNFEGFVGTLSLLDSAVSATGSVRISSGGSDFDLACTRRGSSGRKVFEPVEAALGVGSLRSLCCSVLVLHPSSALINGELSLRVVYL